MAKNHLIEELGPKGRRKVRIGTAISLVVLALLAAVVLMRLNDRGQLEAGKWTDLFEGGTIEFLANGLWASLKAAVVAGILATALGFGLALMRLSKSVVASTISVTWVELFRGIPLLLTILGVFAVAGSDDKLGVFWSVVVGLMLYNSAVLSEIFRSGVRSLDRGQTEAAQAVGMTYWQTMFLVVLPQAVRRMIPAIVAQMATLTKDVSLGYVVSYPEFVRRGAGLSNIPGSRVGNFQAYVFVGVVYFCVIWAMAKLAELLERRTESSPKLATLDEDEELAVELAGVGDSTAVPI
ncbi:MAG: amino acid ABC transporter permease [Acidimicrobiales bacterium]